MSLYRISEVICGTIFRAYFRQQVEGVESVPDSGAFVLAANHVSYLDPPVLGVACPRRVHFMAKAELFDIPVLGLVIRQLGAFPVHRNGADRQAIRWALQLLDEGRVVGVFPEGTRSRSGKLLNPQGGAALLALKAGVPVVPAGIWGTGDVDGPFHFPKPVRIGVRFGKPLDFGHPRVVNRKAIDDASERIMSEVQRLLLGATNGL